MGGRPPFDDEAGLEAEADLLDAPPGTPGARGLIPDTVRKALLAGVGALFMTEEGARRLAREWKLPKELIGFIGQQAQGAKDEVLRVFSEEIRRFLESEKLRGEFLKALSTMAIEVKAEIRLKPAEDGTLRPEVKSSVQPRRGRRGKKEPR